MLSSLNEEQGKDVHSHYFFIEHFIACPSGQYKEMKGIQKEKDEIKPSSFTGDWLCKKKILRNLF